MEHLEHFDILQSLVLDSDSEGICTYEYKYITRWLLMAGIEMKWYDSSGGGIGVAHDKRWKWMKFQGARIYDWSDENYNIKAMKKGMGWDG